MTIPDDSVILSLLDAIPWASTPLGPRSNWPQALKTTWSICVKSRFPMLVHWGPEFVQLYNAAYAKLIGDKHPRAFGRRCQENFPEVWDQIGPMLRSVLNSGIAHYSEDQLLLLDRGSGPEACYFTFSTSPIVGESDHIEGVFGTVTETTRKVLGARRLRALNELEEAMRHATTTEEAAESAASALCACEDVAACQIRLDVDHATIPKSGGDLMVIEPLTDAAKNLGAIVFQRNALCPLDEDYRVFFQLAAKQTAGALTRVHAYECERRRATALEELDRTKTAFVNNVSHEFRTPLTLVLGPLDDLYERVLDVEQRRTIEVARRNALRLQKLVNTLLDFSRVESGRIDAAFARCDVRGLTADIASEFRSAFTEVGLALDVISMPISGDVWLDRAMYEKIVLNLLSNALKFTFTGGVSVTTTSHNGHFVLTVADTGTGIPASELPHLFECFRRVRGARSRTHEGSGLGLALVHELVEIHGGTISVSSTVGEGTTFRVAIPLGSAHLPADHLVETPTEVDRSLRRPFTEEAQAIAQVESSHAATQRGHLDRRPRILVADDNADLRAYIRSLLTPRYHVESVPDGAALLAAASASPPDLIVTDAMMPHVNGIEAVARLRADPATRDVPILMLSARAGEEASIEGLRTGADDYVGKPFTAAQLLARVEALLRRRAIFEEGVAMATSDTREWRLVAAAVEHLMGAQTPSAVLESLTESVVPEFADWCIVLLREHDMLRLAAVAHEQRAKRDLLWLLDRDYPTPADTKAPVGRVVASGQTEFFEEIPAEAIREAARDDVHRMILEALQLRSGIVVPLRTNTGIIGAVIAVQAESERRFEARDVRTLERIVARAAIAYQATLAVERERDIATTLQRALLPGTLPVVDGLEFSISYTPAAEDSEIGGDWYDAFPLGDGRIVMSIGDVVGHGLDAAVAMAALRHAIRAYAVEDSSPCNILAHLNRVLIREGRGDLATALIATLDPCTLDVVLASAGHYGPVLASPGGDTVEHLAMSGCMLGVDEDTVCEERSFRLAAGSTLVCYTDGLVESERDPITAEYRLTAATRRAVDSHDVARAIHTEIFQGSTPHDDVAVFAVTALAALQRLDLTTTSGPEKAAGIRLAVRRFLSNTGLDAERLDDAVTATGEAVGNVIEHAYPGRIGELALTGRKTLDGAVICVRDFGAWHDRKESEGRGLGLPLMRALVDDVQIEHTPFGTNVELIVRFAASPPAGIPSAVG